MSPARLLALPVALAALGCGSPLRDDWIERLGPEKDGVSPGPTHRPGQPCVAPCHDGEGPGNLRISVGGTIYQRSGSNEPMADALVHLIDSKGVRYDTGTNCAGNFFVQRTDYVPRYPMWVSVEFGGVVNPMGTPIFRDGSCATCHYDPPGTASAGPVVFAPVDIGLPAGGCR